MSASVFSNPNVSLQVPHWHKPPSQVVSHTLPASDRLWACLPYCMRSHLGAALEAQATVQMDTSRVVCRARAKAQACGIQALNPRAWRQPAQLLENPVLSARLRLRLHAAPCRQALVLGTSHGSKWYITVNNEVDLHAVP